MVTDLASGYIRSRELGKKQLRICISMQLTRYQQLYTASQRSATLRERTTFSAMLCCDVRCCKILICSKVIFPSFQSAEQAWFQGASTPPPLPPSQVSALYCLHESDSAHFLEWPLSMCNERSSIPSERNRGCQIARVC